MDASQVNDVVRMRREPAIVLNAPSLVGGVLPRTTMPLGRAVKRVACGSRNDEGGANAASVYFSCGVLDADECRELWSRLGSKLTDGIEHVL